MRTIIQHIGPLYGELNTGTVFGQPNGSIAISQNLVPTPDPSSAESTLWSVSYYTKKMDYTKFKIEDSSTYWNFYSVDSTGLLDSSRLFMVDLLSDVTETNTTTKLQISTDENFSDIIFSENIQNSLPTSYVVAHFSSSVSKPSLTKSTTYYIRILLYSSAGTYLYKKSETISMTYAG